MEQKKPRRVLPKKRARVRVRARVKVRKKRIMFGNMEKLKFKIGNLKLLLGSRRKIINPQVIHKMRLIIAVGKKFRRWRRAIFLSWQALACRVRTTAR